MLPAPKMQMRSIRPCMMESLSDAEAREYPAEQLVGADLARDLAERLLRVRELLRDELSALALEQQPLRFLHVLASPAQCLEMPPPGGQCSLARRRIAHAFLEVPAQQIETFACQR